MLRYDPSRRSLAFGLAVLAGYVDAMGFLKLGGLFVSFMSGNSTRLGIGLAQGSGAAAVAAGLIAAFVAGVMGGSILTALVPKMRKAAALGLVTMGLFGAAVLQRIGFDAVALGAMAATMGCTNTVFQHEGEVTIGVTYITGALVKLGQRLAGAWLGGDRTAWIPYLGLWLSLVSGAAAGALAFARLGLDGLWLACMAAAALSGWAWRIGRRTAA
ncbi:YoaK family protein [Flavisphingomonas formosensis]|uniref:YoaK family protein n=1 Tax=Flavisphingomonas formosensis TaxID=861534 RepID=UPI0012FCCDF8|nr:DUF1275 family protein [Sphingomonas formosensis]